MMIANSLSSLLAVAALIFVLPVSFGQTTQKAAAPATGLKDITVSFKLDPQLTQGLYMGERWVSPPTFSAVREGKEITVEARVQGLDATGNMVKISPQWIPAVPEMVTVSPGQGDAVKITVRRTGQSSLKVVSQGFSKELFIKAKDEGDAIQVDIAQVQSASGGPQEPKKDAKAQKEKLSYSLGYNAGSRYRENAVDLDPEIFNKAFKEGLADNKANFTEQEMREAMEPLLKEMAAKQAGQKKQAAERQKQATEKNKEEGAAFLVENAKKDGVVTMPSGLQYEIIKEGTGKSPGKSDKVEVHYRGTLINGTEFDSSYKRGKPATFGVDKVIKGWTEALQLMKEGAKWTLYIPPNLAYGARAPARGVIGPNATLIFEVELISVQ